MYIFQLQLIYQLHNGNFMIEKFLLFLRSFILNWAFVLGFIFSILAFSQYIFGPKNLYDDAKEVLSRNHDEQRSLNDLIYYNRYRR